MTEDPKKNPALKDVAPGSDADETPSTQIGETALNPDPLEPNEKAAAMKGNKKPGPADAPVQVRPAGSEAQATDTRNWDSVDEAVDESFPASDASAKY